MHRECWKRFPRHRLRRKRLVGDPGMHHGTCVTQVPWCMSGSLTRGGGENVPVFPARAQPVILGIWQETRCTVNRSALSGAIRWHIGQHWLRLWLVALCVDENYQLNLNINFQRLYVSVREHVSLRCVIRWVDRYSTKYDLEWDHFVYPCFLSMAMEALIHANNHAYYGKMNVWLC